jgi:hypothetical protein
MSRAEECANQLPVKMVGLLGLFIFRIVLGITMLPVDKAAHAATPAKFCHVGRVTSRLQ